MNEEVAKRRKIRTELRTLLEVAHIKKSKLSDLQEDAFDELRNANNEVSQGITHTRELQIGAEVLKELAIAVQAQGSKIDDMSLKYDIVRFCGALGRYDSDGFSWANLGRDAGVLFRSVPSYQ